MGTGSVEQIGKAARRRFFSNAKIRIPFKGLVLAACVFTTGFAQSLPTGGCPMAHCDAQMSDQVRLDPPLGEVEVLWSRTELPGESSGARGGVGCSSNGSIAVCSLAGETDNVVAYDYDGNRLWTSGTLLNWRAKASAPLIFDNGDVLACDDQFLIKFDASGNVLWQSPLPFGGVPISPVLTDSNVIVLATWQGPIYAFDNADGSLLGSHFVRPEPGSAGFFETVNTPAVRGNRTYVVMHYQVDGERHPDHLGWLVAIDVDRNAVAPSEVLREAWHFVFGADSRASPLVMGNVILFDGDRLEPATPAAPHIFAVFDGGASPILLWKQSLFFPIMASFARDPRGGFWYYGYTSKWLVRRTVPTGHPLQIFNLDVVLDEPGVHIPLSVMSITGPDANPILIVAGVNVTEGIDYVAAIDLSTESLLWKTPIGESAIPDAAGQFCIITDGTHPRLVFTTYFDGPRALGLRPPLAGR